VHTSQKSAKVCPQAKPRERAVHGRLPGEQERSPTAIEKIEFCLVTTGGSVQQTCSTKAEEIERDTVVGTVSHPPAFVMRLAIEMDWRFRML
jgi:hypothetical protein